MVMFPGTLLVYFCNHFFTNSKSLMTQVSLIMVFTPHILLISISRSLYFDSFSATFAQVFCSDGMAMSKRMHSIFALCLIMISSFSSYYFPVGLDEHVPLDGNLLVLSDGLLLLFIPLVNCLDFVFNANLSVQVSCYFVVSMDILCLC